MAQVRDVELEILYVDVRGAGFYYLVYPLVCFDGCRCKTPFRCRWTIHTLRRKLRSGDEDESLCALVHQFLWDGLPERQRICHGRYSFFT